jgi:hypothetical protein
MPNRLIREGWLDSEAIDKLSADAERFFLRLCLAADDAGRFDGRRDILRSRLFPLKFGLRASDVEKLLQLCEAERLIIPYVWEGKPFVQIARCQRCSPAMISKFPWRDGSHKIAYAKRDTRDGEKEFVLTSLSQGIKMPSISGPIPLDPEVAESTESGTESGTESLTPLPPKGACEVFLEFWAAYPKKVGKGAAEQMWKRHVKASVHERIFASIARHKGSEQWRKDAGQFIPNPATWLKEHRWEDEPRNNYAAPEPRLPPAPTPEWVDTLMEIRRLLPDPDANAVELRKLGQTLPASAWSMLSLTEKNQLNQILKGKK